MAWVEQDWLDDEQRLTRLDSRRTLRALATAGAQVRHARTLTEEAGFAALGSDRPRGVILAALGGSAIVADVIDLLSDAASSVPVVTRRGLPLPGWVGPLDLVVAVSLSGRAPGPLALAAEAGRRGCRLLTVGAADSPLADVTARARGLHVPVSVEGLTSRTALWSTVTPLVLALTAASVLDVPAGVLEDVAGRLDAQAERYRPGSDAFVNPAKSLAVTLAGGVPVVLGDGRVGGVAASRAVSMLTRTARMPAMSGELPDAAAQIVSCFAGPYGAGGEEGAAYEGAGARDIFADPYLDGPPPPRLQLLALRDAPDGDEGAGGIRGSELMDAVLRSADAAGVPVSQEVAEPGHPLVRLAGLVALVDFTSAYLAIGLGHDPGLSPVVTDLRDAAGS